MTGTDFTQLTDEADYYGPEALLYRLTNGLRDAERQVVFVVGSALTAPHAPGAGGVPGVDAVIELIKSGFTESRQEEMVRAIAGSANKYQDAFRFLLGNRGPHAANEVIRKAVASARIDALSRGTGYALDVSTTEEACRAFEIDHSGWSLSPAVDALGRLAVSHPQHFGKTVLTTNFDPLISVSIAAAGGTSYRTILHRDGNLLLTDGDGTHVVHLHGYWYGSDTLHTPRQLNQNRPQLRSSLASLLRNQLVVVLAYGGWDDAFTQALVDVAIDDNAYPEVIWCFYDQIPSMRTQLLELLRPGLDRGRISFYGGINCHAFLPELADAWKELETPAQPARALPLRPVAEDFETADTPDGDKQRKPPHKVLRPLMLNAEEDRPPVLDFYVGRREDLTELENADGRVTFITGIGGQGKSALAASFFASEKSTERFDYRLWRDCKEQSEKFEDHLVHLIEALNDGRVLSGELSKQPIDVLADLFCALTSDLPILVIFDNVDHYVDLEARMLAGAAGAFVDRFLENDSQARLVFTCRPSITADQSDIFTKRLEGLGLDAACELFALRRANVAPELVADAHETTSGHAFWLDLLAAQVAARAPTVRLEDLLKNISTGTGEIPDVTLRSIWQSLRDREQMVLQALAESLRPVSISQLSDYLRTKVNFKQTSKAVRVLRDLNLLVVKILDQGEEGFELHPVIRAFIHKTFKRSERIWFIDAILAFYSAFFGVHRSELSKRPSASTIRHWIEGAELCLNAGHYDQAFQHLDDIRGPLRRNASPVEFVRVAHNLLSAVPVTEWTDHEHFDSVFKEYHRSLVNLGRLDDAKEVLDQYEETLEGKDARYINYCDMQTYMYWSSGDYIAAIKWGTDGADLKRESGVDTHYGSDHNLALAQRDSGAVDPALTHFLNGTDIDEVLDPENIDVDQGGTFYGNVGRCFHLMEQKEPALICYTKSAHLIETEHEDSDRENQAYIRQWIGELLLAKGERETALFFFQAAYEKWSAVSPPRASKLLKRIGEEYPNQDIPSAEQAENFSVRWIKASGKLS